jgi:PIN domain nuclease of toxin-antitoxin system
MNLLLDTHALLWWLDDNPTLLTGAKEAIADGGNVVFVSAVTIWEIHIKRALGKLRIPGNFRNVLEQQAFEMLPVTADHAYFIGELQPHHRDPFDRMLIAQALFEGFTLITRDDIFKLYEVSTIRA